MAVGRVHGTGSVAELRALAHRVADVIVDWHVRAAHGAPGRIVSPPDLATLDTAPPQRPSCALAVLDRVMDQVAPFGIRADHPRNFGAIPSPADPVAAVADGLATALNLTTVNGTVGAAAAQIELVTARWLAEGIGMPAGSGGLFVSGGALANLTALATARHTGGPGVVYYAEDAHPTPRARPLLRGLGAADSVTLDPHKWLFQPFGVGCLLLRDPALLAQAFAMTTHYLPVLQDTDAAAHLGYAGVELTRPCRGSGSGSPSRPGVWPPCATGSSTAWTPPTTSPTACAHPDLELLTGPSLAITCFRHRADQDIDQGSGGGRQSFYA